MSTGKILTFFIVLLANSISSVSIHTSKSLLLLFRHSGLDGEPRVPETRDWELTICSPAWRKPVGWHLWHLHPRCLCPPGALCGVPAQCQVWTLSCLVVVIVDFWGFPVLYSWFSFVNYFCIVAYICWSQFLSPSHPLLPPLVSISLASTPVTLISTSQTTSSQPFF